MDEQWLNGLVRYLEPPNEFVVAQGSADCDQRSVCLRLLSSDYSDAGVAFALQPQSLLPEGPPTHVSGRQLCDVVFAGWEAEQDLPSCGSHLAVVFLGVNIHVEFL